MNIANARACLQAFDFSRLFIEELGWDCHRTTITVSTNGHDFTLASAAHKRGMLVLVCSTIPPHAVRAKIDQQITKYAHEHIIIFHDPQKTTQLWQWTRREPGKPIARREHLYHRDQPGDSLLQKLRHLAFSLEEEESLTILDAACRAKAAFDLDRVTKRFYDRFKDQHNAFLAFIRGIPDDDARRWYASVMLNRLMFIYFIQRKGFLDGDTNYLRHRLARTREQLGNNKFYSFYRHFLLRLFHEGLGGKKRSPELEQLLGRIPYLNGGIFDKHEIEKSFPNIEIPDKAFVQVFDYFDQYQWHLDERPLRADNEINPDVLGYIFEKYINQKQMGAYYTKEDITEYIGKNTILPFLLDAVRTTCKIAFDNPDGHTVWDLLRNDPDRYIYEAVRRGVVAGDGSVIPEASLPEFVQNGMHDPKARMFDKRYNLGQAEIAGPGGENLALPTETWREYVARRQRCLELRAKLANGEVRQVNDLITFNLNIRQFAQDIIENSEGPELVRAFWHALESISVLDPTCGSGAFLFAALNILEPLYEACLDRMESVIAESDQAKSERVDKVRDSGADEDSLIADKTSRYIKYHDFRDILARVAQHPSPRYFIFKSIILNNLYGVDIMEEAVEICRLRLFLKLAAQVEPDERKENFGIEPLPDIDFNIKAGNTLVGYATFDDVKSAIGSQFDFDNTMERIQQQAEEIDRIFALFRKMQTEESMEAKQFVEAKQQLRKELGKLQEELNCYLAKDYGIDPKKKDAYATWLKSHQPFHWFIEFYGIMKKGGFDVIIGNPPYVEYTKVSREYSLLGYDTLSCGNIYAMVIERSEKILSNTSYFGMIVQLPLVCTDRMKPVQKLCSEQFRVSWYANFDDRPSRLFDGLEHIRATVFLLHRDRECSQAVYSTSYNRWKSEFREALFQWIHFSNVSNAVVPGAIPKIGDVCALHILERLRTHTCLGGMLNLSDATYVLYFHNAPQYWIRAMDFKPYFWNERDGEQLSTQVKTLLMPNKEDASVAVAVLNSNLFYWWFLILSDCRHLNMREIESFPVGLDRISVTMKKSLVEISQALMADLKHHKVRKGCQYKATGKVVYDEFYPKNSKPIIDQIDQVLARHYGLTDEELDFIINYDIKYRMGKDNDED